MIKKKRILLGVCASIAAYRACEIINRLKGDGIDVVCCMSRDAGEFITPLTLQALSRNRVFKDMFEARAEWDTLHISLADSAGLVLIAPATSDIISKVACGICDELLSCVIASTRAPVLFAPAMNDNMYNNKILQANIEKLKSLGYHFIGPIKGRLACAKKGIGHIADTGDIIKKAKSLLK
jgi:phosphopantothenoylcysteine decarboxylase/phosphopantothenate--cysteine ligase